jgi:NFACT protein RNA binding domain
MPFVTQTRLLGGRVQRAQMGANWLWLEFRVPGENVYLLLVAGGTGPRVAQVGAAELVHAGVRTPMSTWLGARGERVAKAEGLYLLGWSTRRITLGQQPLEPQHAATSPHIHWKAEQAQITATHRDRVSDPLAIFSPESFGAKLAAPLALRAELAPLALLALREQVARENKQQLDRWLRRQAAIAGDLAAMRRCEDDAAVACWFIHAVRTAPRGTLELCAIDWTASDGEGKPITRKFSADTTPAEQLERLFARSKRMALARPLAASRLAAADTEVAKLRERAAGIASADATTLSQYHAALVATPSPQSRSQSGAESAAKNGARAHPYREYRSSVGDIILVGKGARENDVLTMHLAKPEDLWLHAKGQRGSHVIVRLTRGKSCAEATLIEAAHLAAHFSGARGETTAEIQTSPKRLLRKPKGSAPGMVLVPREKVLLLRVDARVLARVLASENT